MKQIGNFGGGTTSGGATKETISKVKTSRETVTSSTTLQDDNDFSFSVKANTTYLIESNLTMVAPSSGGFKWACTVPSGASGRVSSYLSNGSSYNTADTDITTGSGANTGTTVGNTALFQIIGYVTTTTAGTLNLQWSQHTSNATATYIERGSTMILTEV